VSVLLCVVAGLVKGITQLQDVVYILCAESPEIIRFDAVTHDRLDDITVKDMSAPQDIAACQQTDQLYIADSPGAAAVACVWRVLAKKDGEDVERLLPKSPSDKISPYALSVTSSRLLVTSLSANQLTQFDAVGDELRRVDLPDDTKPSHAVESPVGTFIVSHRDTQLNRWQVSEVDNGGQVLRQFSGSRLLPLGLTQHIAVDSQGNIFVADFDNSRVLLLDSQLALRRVIIDEHQLKDKSPWRLCYMERTGQLLVGLRGDIAVFDVLRR